MNHQAKKKFGQNFIRDKNLLMKIVRESNIEDKNVIEVGPGQGALTTFLASNAKKVIAYEIDHSLKPFLDAIKNEYENLEIIYEDFLEADISQYTEDLHVVANVPYYITTPILFKILETDNIKTASLMIQKEVCDRLLAKPNHKQYNALSIILQYQAHVSKMMDVKRQMFFPIPNVDSAVIRIVKRDEPLIEKDKELVFVRLVKEAFKQKRKTLVNNWYEAYHVNKQELEMFLKSNGYSPNVRAEALAVEDFIKLARMWSYD
ncbi:16S rRNA (adenine(1518)-N(6)/adenine(1519)-N(6))-dimethyltransferase RsmA [Peloplasma aerotolerans]|uniref:Ribosomal RNA small subunit methyltransferase A n=1 Tax=Peloplasma aerotolerans TaxID=3044389 RepID=A0AAW6U8D9_9MOLU|nr:16S rRNA (adenine(1518)-N(6)/adenine(1519)-N(6))-dimethyltransferase RsmA [Mariniplasma sp. M4Ah]MDI6452224.1 16S rRNA (adenine(1518)-N(6)/adenine(1519)-N(6))-dimethyltransferase RsmA [Mariniplasma sp. M4Ah]MDR4969032.1 16S rRNA (adenine(1518)-N(6)/adenine(1519)-N(6))-dimethyltransferase RsmA [Acholeplasmataceae bacterium]